jgi:hypothetical protein
MNSKDLFDKDNDLKQKWQQKPGIYVISQPKLTAGDKAMYKIGYGTDIMVRLSNYRTAYSPKYPFLIHSLYAIPEAVIGKRARFTLLSEKMIHKTLQLQFGSQVEDSEWYYNLREIMSVIVALRKKHLKEITGASKWLFDNFTPFQDKFYKVNLIKEKDAFIGGILKNIVVKDRTALERRATASKYLEKEVTGVKNGTSYIGTIKEYNTYTRKFLIDYDGFTEELTLAQLLQKLRFETVEEVEPVIEKRKTRSESRKIELRNRTVKVD